ncbi:unnamed protein product, partial [Brassica rapa subsp. trilocularis]
GSQEVCDRASCIIPRVRGLRPSFDDNGLQTIGKIWSRNSRGKLGLSRFPTRE